MRPKWYPDWAGQTAVIVASGPSAVTVPLHLGIGLAKFIAVNDSWRLCPWADILFAGDYKWWEHNQGCPRFTGLKVTIDRRASETPEWNLHRLRCQRVDDRMDFDNYGSVGWGGNSGFNAFNLTVQLGASKIILVGFDMTLVFGAHWHGPHPEGLKNPEPRRLDHWQRSTDAPAKLLQKRGITVINCSLISRLKKYPKMTFADALEI